MLLIHERALYIVWQDGLKSPVRAGWSSESVETIREQLYLSQIALQRSYRT